MAAGRAAAGAATAAAAAGGWQDRRDLGLPSTARRTDALPVWGSGMVLCLGRMPLAS